MITEQSKRLGMWMDWDNDYYTFSDTNIEYIWRFLKAVHERGWLYLGHRSTVWCPRCGTSISQHELFAGEYKELEHPSLDVRFPLKGREARRSSCGRRRHGRCRRTWPPRSSRTPSTDCASGEWRLARDAEDYDRVVSGEELVGLEYGARSTTCPRRRESCTA